MRKHFTNHSQNYCRNDVYVILIEIIYDTSRCSNYLYIILFSSFFFFFKGKTHRLFLGSKTAMKSFCLKMCIVNDLSCMKT